MRPIAIVSDIAGTTSSTRFIKDVLDVYAEQFLPDFIREHKDERDVSRQLRSMSDKVGVNFRKTEQLIEHLLDWMRDDKKVPELLTLQGMVWEQGYEQGEYQAHVYADVPERLQQWRDDEINLYTFSSASERAQRLYFRFTSQGDLRLMFAGYFDHTIGPKQAVASYQGLADGVALRTEQMLYISNSEGELDAAAEAGMQTIRVEREEETGNAPEDVKSSHTVVSSFSDIIID